MMSSVTEIGKFFPLYLGTSLGILNELISLNLQPYAYTESIALETYRGNMDNSRVKLAVDARRSS